MHIKPVRYQNQGCLHFIMFSCYLRMKRSTRPQRGRRSNTNWNEFGAGMDAQVAGYVVMPEHVHLLIGEPERGKLSVAIQMLKQIISRKLRPADQPQFWQVRYYDFPVWSEAKRIEKLRYMHRNPVKRGLATRPEDWRWSSFLHYATGVEGTVEIESEWTTRRRERMGFIPTLSAGNPDIRFHARKNGASPQPVHSSNSADKVHRSFVAKNAPQDDNACCDYDNVWSDYATAFSFVRSVCAVFFPRNFTSAIFTSSA